MTTIETPEQRAERIFAEDEEARAKNRAQEDKDYEKLKALYVRLTVKEITALMRSVGVVVPRPAGKQNLWGVYRRMPEDYQEEMIEYVKSIGKW